MDSPTVNPILHSVWAHTCLVEALSREDKRLKRKRLKLYANVAQPGDCVWRSVSRSEGFSYPLDEQHTIVYTIPDRDLMAEFEEIDRVYIQPMLGIWIGRIQERMKGTYQFARMQNIPTSLGIREFRTDFCDVSVRCIMQYNAAEGGMTVRLDCLYGTF